MSSWSITSWQMKFRQRIAWLAVLLYLAASFSFVYYIFEINEHFNSLALEHVHTYHYSSTFVVTSVWQHVTDIPLAVWLLIFLLPYLQVFGMLLAWTRAEPWRSTAFQWPGIVVNKWKKLYKRLKGHHGSKAINSTVVCNGHIVIDAWELDGKCLELIATIFSKMGRCLYELRTLWMCASKWMWVCFLWYGEWLCFGMTSCYLQSLEFVEETRILAEMKIENCPQNFFPWKKVNKHTFFLWKLDDGSVNANWRYKNWYLSWSLVC